MDLDATPYRDFLAIAETRSFGRAAEQLHVSQPALSARIKEFERRLGFQLFNRTSRHVELTAQGQLFLGNAQRIVAETRWVRRAADHIRDNKLLIGTSFYTALIAERNAFTDRFMLENPNVAVRITTRSEHDISRDLQQGLLDVGIVIEHEVIGAPQWTGIAANRDTFERLTIASRDVTLLFPVEHPLAAKPEIALSDLQGEAVVMINRTHGVSLCEQINDRIRHGGAEFISPPEGHAVAVERYAKNFRKPAVCLGWFDDHLLPDGPPMVSRKVDGLDIATKLVLLRNSGEPRPGAALLWDMAAEIAA